MPGVADPLPTPRCGKIVPHPLERQDQVRPGATRSHSSFLSFYSSNFDTRKNSNPISIVKINSICT
ncbi:hypothetical protein MBAV_001955 [Candidatus Magnetobacterium bavaricum]|uniref:Uncharacterized protein n=1 Tax=Candidatus Magnetobacterium bavaricum TaxID=29290 RepID=A0A0F3GYU8_9BACT|nr:hypothetical protein MBAV_001955 [Candidatus Magnetobacterium bavaricum]